MLIQILFFFKKKKHENVKLPDIRFYGKLLIYQ